MNTEADDVIDVAARFVAFGKANGLPAATVDQVNQTLESVYKVRFPEDTTLAGLQKILQDKTAAAGAAPRAGLALPRSERGVRGVRRSTPLNTKARWRVPPGLSALRPSVPQ